MFLLSSSPDASQNSSWIRIAGGHESDFTNIRGCSGVAPNRIWQRVPTYMSQENVYNRFALVTLCSLGMHDYIIQAACKFS